MEPPSRLEFSNSSGGWLDCSATGHPQPQIDWLSLDGSPLAEVPALRRSLRNGTLLLMPFSAELYRQDVHSAIYRCSATNAVGTVVSRDVHVRAGKSHSSLYNHFLPKIFLHTPEMKLVSGMRKRIHILDRLVLKWLMIIRLVESVILRELL
ncbi:hypothetical protein AAG570_011718 [Ranatra chinensis]|uniref:Ig-like domain-containing protein n=1 Tax=Ranatra chinensis TaxID=642074 RepID=A0ABD0YGP7_9HEMI